MQGVGDRVFPVDGFELRRLATMPCKAQKEFALIKILATCFCCVLVLFFVSLTTCILLSVEFGKFSRPGPIGSRNASLETPSRASERLREADTPGCVALKVVPAGVFCIVSSQCLWQSLTIL